MNTPFHPLLAELDRRNLILLEQLRASDVWRAITDAGTPVDLAVAIVRNLLRQVLAYGSHVMLAITTSIGRLAAMPDFLTSAAPLSRFLLEELSHPNMARDSFLQLGGDIRQLQEIPPAAAINLAAVARFLSEQRHPLAILGPLYLFECTTRELAPELEKLLERNSVKSRFIEVHAREDIAHAAQVGEMICTVAAKSAEGAHEIDAAHQCFSAVYPAPVWETAFKLAANAKL